MPKYSFALPRPDCVRNRRASGGALSAVLSGVGRMDKAGLKKLLKSVIIQSLFFEIVLL